MWGVDRCAREPHIEGMRIARRKRTLAVVVAIVAASAVLGGLWRWVQPSGATDAALQDVVLRYELAKAPVRPSTLVGKPLTGADRAALQSAFERRLSKVAGGRLLEEWRAWDYAAALLADEWGTRQLVGCSGEVVYWDFLRRDLDGTIQVRAGVVEHHEVVHWDASLGRAIPQEEWTTGVSVNHYTLQRADDVWKVFRSDHWRFYDVATGTLATGP